MGLASVTDLGGLQGLPLKIWMCCIELMSRRMGDTLLQGDPEMVVLSVAKC